MKPLALVAVLLAVAGGAYLLLTDSGPSRPTPANPSDLPEIPNQGPEEPGAAIAAPAPDRPGRAAATRETEPVRVSQTSPEASFPQGVQGQVLSSAGGAVQDAEVYLLHAAAPQDMIAQLAALGSGGRIRAKIAARTTTDAQGMFKLGAPPTSGPGGYDLRVKAPRHVVYERKLRVLENQWEKLGLIQLEKGKALIGTVRDAVTKNAVTGAVVRIKIPNLNFLAPTPGYEDGIETTSDSTGRYELAGLPKGPMELTALAKGYGTFSQSDIVFADTESTKSQDIDLPKGFVIEGWVTAADGDPIAKARVEALPFSQSLPTGYAYSDSDGRFSVFGLGEGEYIVSAEARGFVRNERKPVKAGSKEVQILLEIQGQLRIRVRSRQGRPIPRYRAELKRFFPENPDNYGRSDVPPVEVRAPKNGEYLLQGINPGSYVLQVDAVGFAKTYSKEFTIAEGQTEPALIEVTMNQGATIFGIVTDEGGKPVAGASVSTLETTYQDNPLMAMFRPLMTVKVTERTTVTNSKGRFKLDKLTPASYQVKVDHPGYTRAYFKPYEVKDGQRFDAGFLRLRTGGIVRGVVYGPGGRPVPAAKVTVSSVGGKANVFEQVFTDNKGKFKVGRPLPPGKYELQATRTDHANPLMQLADIRNSQTEINVQRGMGPVVVHITRK